MTLAAVRRIDQLRPTRAVPRGVFAGSNAWIAKKPHRQLSGLTRLGGGAVAPVVYRRPLYATQIRSQPNQGQ